MSRPTLKVAFLLVGSGACALIYETVWLRELRLVFGASTAASATVVACFIGGLGAGGLYWGSRADSHPKPLALYGNLEGAIAISASLTPLLLRWVRLIYVSIGGTGFLGLAIGNALRLLLAAAVFALPTFLMGGTLPAAASAVERVEDRGRRTVSLLYGANTMGAVVGCLVSTFILFETYGTRLTLWIACLLNGLVAVSARSLARSTVSASRTPEQAPAPDKLAAPVWFTVAAAALTGFVFCLMELVWYRMLGPLLGGTVFTFGLILAEVLLGIGLGAVFNGSREEARPSTTVALAWTCLTGALCMALPYAFGDRIAVLAALLHPLGAWSFVLEISVWAFITAIVVLPAAFVSGLQFPLLIGLLGRGNERVGRDVGLAYAANTLGGMGGALAGGFGLIPALTAPGCWRLAVVLLIAIAAGAISFDARRRPITAVAPICVGVFGFALLRADGPTAAWRHSPIGVGRVDFAALRSPNDVRMWENFWRRTVAWQADGRESSVALTRDNSVSFVVNGKGDGNARTDAGTAVPLGLLGALLHPQPAHAMVIGLGTGESAGWLAAIDTIQDVDVAELEPVIVEVARESESINRGALENPKVHIHIGDARELLLTSKARYDLIASEPSNPFRAGVASLFTRDYYDAIAARLQRGGFFLQWLQAYEVAPSTVRTVYATVGAVFPEVETWELASGDMLLIAAKEPVKHDIAQLRTRLAEEPYRSALAFAWRATDVESVLARFVATTELTRAVAAQEADRINTDDQNFLEFGFARHLGTGYAFFSIDDVRRAARALGAHRPAIANGEVDWDLVDDAVVTFRLGDGGRPTYPTDLPPERMHRVASLRAFDEGQTRSAVREWRAQPREPQGPTETAILGVTLAELGDDGALTWAARLRAFNPGEAEAIVARLRLRQGRLEEAAASLEALFSRLRTDPWPWTRLVTGALEDAKELVLRARSLAPRLAVALREPFAVYVADDARKEAWLASAIVTGGPACVEAFGGYEPHVRWEEEFLLARYECYRAATDPRTLGAQRDVLEWRANRPEPFGGGLRLPVR
jgi:spermidine synthase